MRPAARALAAAALVTAVVFAAPLAAQQQPVYEVASVKPNQNAAARQGLQTAPGRYTFTAYTLKSLIDVAFQRSPFDQREKIGGPDWVDKDRFDVVVQAPAGAVLNGPDGFPSGVFAMVILKQWIAAGIFLVAVFAVLGAWHAKEPQQA